MIANRVIHILIIVAVTNLFVMLGNLVGGAFLVHLASQMSGK